MSRLPAPAHRVIALVLAAVGIAWLAILALRERQRTLLRRRRGLRPRLIWGPLPLISLKYWSEAMRGAGYTSVTCVSGTYPINRREDFDVHLDRFGSNGRFGGFAPYRQFGWTLRHGDLFFKFLDGGFLRSTPLRWLECRLMKLAGKGMIVSPYGGDVAVAGSFGGLEDELYADYPDLRRRSDEIKRWVDHTTKFADLVVRNWQIGYLPRYDAVWLSELAIDVDRWPRSQTDSGADGIEGSVSILHAPNHRRIKGTALLERTVDELRAQGLKVDLELVQGMPNEELRSAVASADVIADQFLMPGYAMAAVEAMALGRPVMVNLGALPEELRSTEAFRECPAIDTNPENLTDQLRQLVQDPGLRRERGVAGREFVERFHSYEVVARVWTQIIDHVWRGTPLPDSLLPPGRLPALGDLPLREGPG